MEALEQIFNQLLKNPIFLPIFLIWLLFWKGFALWRSASKRQLIWFVILLVINTMGLLEILYILFLYKYSLDNGKLLSFLESKFSKSPQNKNL